MARDRAARPEARSIRLFVAVEVPDAVQRQVDLAIGPIRERFPRARWVTVENRHVTVKFLGATWPRLVGWVHGTVRDVAAAHAPFEVRLAGVGTFPSARRARVVWAGVDDPTAGLAAIAEGLDAALAEHVRPETRPFRAHLTVARSEPPLRLDDDPIEAALSSDAFPVDRLVLFRSHLARPAPRYEALERFPLSGAAG